MKGRALSLKGKQGSEVKSKQVPRETERAMRMEKKVGGWGQTMGALNARMRSEMACGRKCVSPGDFYMGPIEGVS